jgi:hypothetical protein
VILILNGEEDNLLSLLAVVCSTWININSGTSKRDAWVHACVSFILGLRVLSRIISLLGASEVSLKIKGSAVPR